MTELETFAKATLDNGGTWHTLEHSGRFALCKSQDKYMIRNNYYFTSPVYQIFEDGKRIFTTMVYWDACVKFRKLKEGAQIGND